MKAIEILDDLMDELDNLAYEIDPSKSDYAYVGVAETSRLDKQHEIATIIYDLIKKYSKLEEECEDDD